MGQRRRQQRRQQPLWEQRQVSISSTDSEGSTATMASPAVFDDRKEDPYHHHHRSYSCEDREHRPVDDAVSALLAFDRINFGDGRKGDDDCDAKHREQRQKQQRQRQQRSQWERHQTPTGSGDVPISRAIFDTSMNDLNDTNHREQRPQWLQQQWEQKETTTLNREVSSTTSSIAFDDQKGKNNYFYCVYGQAKGDDAACSPHLAFDRDCDPNGNGHNDKSDDDDDGSASIEEDDLLNSPIIELEE